MFIKYGGESIFYKLLYYSIPLQVWIKVYHTKFPHLVCILSNPSLFSINDHMPLLDNNRISSRSGIQDIFQGTK